MAGTVCHARPVRGGYELKPPNVLWIIADQLRYQALGFTGDPNAVTPAIDALASSGVSCSNAVTPSPVCTPARAALMTALPGNVSGVERHGDFLDPSMATLATTFVAAGYRTSYVGKWHLAPESGAHMVSAEGWVGQDFWVHPRLRGGFQDWFGFNLSNNYYRTYIASGDKVEPRRLPGYQTDALTDLSFEYLKSRVEEHPGQPWFHVVSYESPHPGAGEVGGSAGGYPVPEPFASWFPPESIVVRGNVPAENAEAARVQLAGYYRLIANLDFNVGRLLRCLGALGASNDTLVVFTSDHGEMGGSHGLRNKQVPYDESLRVPLIFRFPGRVPEGVQFDGAISLLDVAPTTLGLAGVGGVGNFRRNDSAMGLDQSDGILRAGATVSEPARDAVLVRWNDTRFSFGNHPYRALRSPSHTLVIGASDDFCLLFDRDEDPLELRNLYGHPGYRPLQRKLVSRLLELLAEGGEPPPDYVLQRLAQDSGAGPP